MKTPRAGADEKRADQRERERDDREQHRPAPERAALFGDGERMNQRRAGEPRHERRILDRIPEPPSAPAELVIRPGAAERDADRQEAPGDGRPRARPTCPRCVEPAADQCGNRERERDGEPDVAHVEHRRVNHHAGILQERIQVLPFGRSGNQPRERIRCQ